MTKIKKPKWLEPIKYDVAKTFAVQDWYEQIYQRQYIAEQLRKNNELDLDSILENPLRQPSAASLNAMFEHEVIAGYNDFTKLGLNRKNISSLTVEEVNRKKAIQDIVMQKHSYITGEFPSKICEKFANNDRDFFGKVAVNVNLFADEREIIKDFQKWLKAAKRFFKYDEYSQLRFKQWALNRCLAYWDLLLWAKKESYTFGSKDSDIPKMVMQEWIFSERIGEKYHGKVVLIDASIRDYKAISTWQMMEALKIRLLQDDAPSTQSSVKMFNPPEKSDLDMDIVEYLKKHGYDESNKS